MVMNGHNFCSIFYLSWFVFCVPLYYTTSLPQFKGLIKAKIDIVKRRRGEGVTVMEQSTWH